ncbi:hypothetical protein ACJJTC_008974 [Scirpophaga incertulas]
MNCHGSREARPGGRGGVAGACGPRCGAAGRVVSSVARAARGHTSLAALRRRHPLCTTRPLGAPRGPRARPASLLLLAAWLAAVAADLACPQEPPAAQDACASCRSYENAREHSLRVIRESLLVKLGFTQAPNTTGRQLPRVPDDLMERFELRPIQNDANVPTRTFVTHTEQDDFLARTDDVLVFAR